MTLITLDINPMQIPAIANRADIIRRHAENYVNHASVHESLDEYGDLVVADLDDAARVEFKRQVRQIRKNI